MGIALFTLSSLFAPLQAFFAPVSGQGAAGRAHAPRLPSTRTQSARMRVPAAQEASVSAPSCQRQAVIKSRPLRVVRVVEPQTQRACAGRMVISGRMADVCAELDRLAAIEAASQSTRH
ncbi:hypothetical protein ACO2Q9_18645 [Variovorax sp. VNK109]|jgi:hypothetical protein|uniref:hypothetical protein n=1 Tax=Variovorax sp. VNK109 TaxID=3400919 RepID=UPI003C09DC71